MTKHGRDGRPLGERVRAAGGWYRYLNMRLIRIAGPASVGPYESEPQPDAGASACPLCGTPMAGHRRDRSGPRTLLRCP